MKQQYFIPEVRAIADVSEYSSGTDIRKTYVINRINVPKGEARGKGYARELLRRILADADTEGARLVLNISESDGLTYPQLKCWYQRHGFKWNTLTRWYERYPKEQTDD